MIGGTDIEFRVGDGVAVADAIFRTIRQQWPEFVIENALDESSPFRPPADRGIPNAPSDEFFIYRDEQAARDWSENGATPENANVMVNVLMGDGKKLKNGFHTITIVVGSYSGEMRSFLKELSDLFDDLTFGMARLSSCLEVLAA